MKLAVNSSLYLQTKSLDSSKIKDNVKILSLAFALSIDSEELETICIVTTSTNQRKGYLCCPLT